MNVCDSKRKAGWHIFGAARFLRFWLLLSFSIKSAFWNHTIDGGYFVSVIRIICPGSARTGGRVYLLLLICTSLSLCLFGHIHFIKVKFFRGEQSQFVFQIAFYVKLVFLIEIRKFLVPLMFGNIKLIAQEWSDTSQLQDALAAVHDCKLIPAHKLPAVKSSDEFAKEKTLPVKKTRRVTIINVISCEFSILD